MVLSASLAANNHYILDENVLELVLEKEATKQAAKVAPTKKAIHRIKASCQKNALQKFVFCPNGLTVPEMRVLVTAATNVSDSPVKKRKNELQEQLYSEPRYNRIQQLAANFWLTMNND